MSILEQTRPRRPFSRLFDISDDEALMRSRARDLYAYLSLPGARISTKALDSVAASIMSFAPKR